MILYLVILIAAILADVVCNNSIIQLFEIQSHFPPITLIIVMSILQMIAAPIQAGFSDFYCRRKSLIIALTFSLFSLLLLVLTKSSGLLASSFLLLSMIINAGVGNTIPIAWSALADVQQKNLRFSLGLTTTAYAIGYITLALFGATAQREAGENAWVWQDIILPGILIALSIGLIWKFYFDLRDIKSNPASDKHRVLRLAFSELKSLSQEIKCRSTLFGLWAYFCWACSQYSTLLLLLESQKYEGTVIVMMIGYIAGIILLWFCQKLTDGKIIRTGFGITITAILLFFIGKPFAINKSLIFSISGFLYTMGNAFLSPSILSLFSKEREFHEQGKGFGLIVSADSAGFLIGVLLVQFFTQFKVSEEKMIIFSSLMFLISWYPYSVYEKIRKNAQRLGGA
jgi:MFS family permease